MNIKNKIKKWLFKEEFEKLQYLYDEISRCNSKLQKAYTMCNETQKMMNEITDVAVDVGFMKEEHSWAVICVKGKMEYVKFIPLNHADAMELRNFLKHFQYSQRIVDSPLAYKAMIGRDLFTERQRWSWKSEL